MKVKYNEFIIGISVTIAILIVITSIMWLEKSNIFASGLHLNLIVQDAKGISVGDEIFYKGVAVGSVQKLNIQPNGIEIVLKLKREIPIPSDSKFEIKDISLLGEKAVLIIPGHSNTLLKSGQTVYGGAQESLVDLTSKGKELSSNLDKILASLDSLSGKENRQALAISIQQLKDILIKMNFLLENGSPFLLQTFKDIHDITSKNKGHIDSLLQQLGSGSTDLGQTIERLNRISKKTETMLLRIEKGKGTIGRLMQDDSLYNNLNRMILHIDSLILDIKHTPKKYFEVKVF